VPTVRHSTGISHTTSSSHTCAIYLSLMTTLRYSSQDVVAVVSTDIAPLYNTRMALSTLTTLSRAALSAHLYHDGYVNVSNVDISSVVISQLRDRYNDMAEMDCEYLRANSMQHRHQVDNVFQKLMRFIRMQLASWTLLTCERTYLTSALISLSTRPSQMQFCAVMMPFGANRRWF
jgi:hypothetical protein